MGTFVVKLCGLKAKNIFFIHNHLWIKKEQFDKELNNKYYERTVRKLHGAGWKNSYFTSADADMLGNECDVSMYPQYYNQHLEKYQVSPHPYLGSFEGDNGEKMTK